MEKPILFNTEMVKSILEGRKTQTRRIIKPKSKNACGFYVTFRRSDNAFMGVYDYDEDESMFESSQTPPCKTGDILWVRETWWHGDILDDNEDIKEREITLYRADKWRDDVDYEFIKWKPSIHMPRAVARLFLKVTDVRVERIQDITEEEAKAEGINYPIVGVSNNVLENGYRLRFCDLWNSLYANWNENPWVWVIEFERMVKSKYE